MLRGVCGVSSPDACYFNQFHFKWQDKQKRQIFPNPRSRKRKRVYWPLYTFIFPRPRTPNNRTAAQPHTRQFQTVPYLASGHSHTAPVHRRYTRGHPQL